jgi:hypothetical protein
MDTDVAVVGGGPAGFAAAVAAARTGRDATLIEAQDVLGGAGTSALVNNFCNAYWDGERFVIGGLFAEVRHRLQGRKAMWTTRGPNTADKVGQEVYDPDRYADELAAICRQAGVDLRLATRCVGADFGGGSTVLDLDDGTRLDARTVVDATGDATLAHRAGVPTTIADDPQPLTYCYMFGPVDLDALAAEIPAAVQYDENVGTRYGVPSYAPEVVDRVQSALAAGDLDLPVPTLYATVSVPGRERYMTTNFGHVDLDDPTDPEALERATEEGRRQMRVGASWLRDNLPGFGGIEVVEEPRQIGVRESRQIEGAYELTGRDLVERRQFEDAVAQCRFPVDVHATDTEVDHGAGVADGSFETGEHYDVPWRSLVPASGPENLVVGGRCISATSIAMSSFRVAPSVMAIGEAAGVTAALAAERDCPIADVGHEPVRERLRATGAVLS